LTVTYQAGRRIQATSTDFGTAGAGIPAVAGGWKELGRTTLGSSGDSIDVSSLADKRYLMFLLDSRSNGTAISTTWKANGSTGNEYSFRRNHDGTETDANTQPSAATSWTSIVTNAFGVGYAANKSGKEKLFLEHEVYQNTAGAGTSTTRTENAFKWTGTDVIDQLTMHNSSSGDIVSGSELVVLGWDPADTHSTNFWEELASVEYSGGTALTSGTITAKKYLWVQAYLKIASGTVDSNLWRFNADTGNNYAARYSRDGATDGANASISHMNINFGAGTRNNQLINMFIINNSANEKLVTGSGISQGASGAGTAPNRLEFSPKWANTSSQITSIQCTQGNALNFESGTIMKVWGSD